MLTTHRATDGIDVITSAFPIPGYGLVPINAFVLHGPEPLLVDTGAVVDRDDFMEALGTVIDPMDLRWIWLTHTDFDHIGSLHRLLDINPDVRVLTSFLSVGAMTLTDPLPLDRVHLVVPGERLPVAGRVLTAMRPPSFDNPATVGFLDGDTGAYVSSDCFGALLQDVPQTAAGLSESDLRAGQHLWATIDSPWLHQVDRRLFEENLDRVRRLKPSVVLSSHLPVASGDMVEQLTQNLTEVPEAEPFVGPDQQALESMLAAMTHGAA